MLQAPPPQFRILPREPGTHFEDDEIAVHVYDGRDMTNRQTKGSFFFAIIAGRPVINGFALKAGMYGCLPRLAFIEASMLQPEDSRIMLVDAKHYQGIFTIGGPMEPVGRLRYIDGCTDTGLIQPIKQGDPCLNALFFPSSTKQTPHTHPSHRVGAIYSGSGYCLTDTAGRTMMEKGDIFVIPTDALHWFQTDDEQSMRIMVFHPDSEVGPTDEVHQMLKATVIA